ncbi:MAG TPA: biopolymer transporter ExbD [Kiritimatiellia bacterium]|nr:biopolymer transporter ExbD [Kiritimatiellia bacterium]
MLGRSRSDVEEVAAEVNLSPLIDIVFLLLIFFMVTSVFIEETGVEIQTPSAMSAKDLEKNSILLAVTAEGEIFFDGQAIALNRLRGVVARLQRERPRPVILLADEESRTGWLVRVIDECKLAGAEQVSVAARP